MNVWRSKTGRLIPPGSGHPSWCERTRECTTENGSRDLHHSASTSAVRVGQDCTLVEIGAMRYDINHTADLTEIVSTSVRLRLSDLETDGPTTVEAWIQPEEARMLAHLLLVKADLAEELRRIGGNTRHDDELVDIEVNR